MFQSRDSFLRFNQASRALSVPFAATAATLAISKGNHIYEAIMASPTLETAIQYAQSSTDVMDLICFTIFSI